MAGLNWDSDIYVCPYCDRDDLVLASGAKRAEILIIGGFPGDKEIQKGKPLVGKTGSVLRSELGRVGLDMRQMRLCNLWLHPNNKNEDCKNYGKQKVMDEVKGRKVILLIGSDAVKEFCNENVSEVSGLEVKSPYFSAPLVFACVQPTTVWHGGLGEVRLSIQKFAKKVKEL
jgi:uracil-DNA glycosylase family 4